MSKKKKKQTSPEVTSVQRRGIPRPACCCLPKKGMTQSTVALHHTCWEYLLRIRRRRTLSDSEAKSWTLRPTTALWSQTHKQRSTTRSLALIDGCMWWNILRQCYHQEDCAMHLVILIRGRQEKLPDCLKVRK